jgi:hypothetical protein
MNRESSTQGVFRNAPVVKSDHKWNEAAENEAAISAAMGAFSPTL